jgi:hypothetical protein
MQGGSYYVGAWFFDGNGDTMYWVIGTVILSGDPRAAYWEL